MAELVGRGEAAPAGSAAGETGDAGPSVKKVVFVCYGPFGCNSATHVAGFAGALAKAGYRVGACAPAPLSEAYRFGEPAFEFFSIDDLAANPEAVVGFDGSFAPSETLLICWTPREIVRRAVAPLVERFGLPYFVHLEDNEEHLTRLHLSQQSAWRKQKPLPPAFTDLARLDGFLRGASGVTVIVERLKELVPGGVPSMVLEPGVELDRFGRKLAPLRRATIRRAVGVPEGGVMLVYPGNVHPANAEEVWRLYACVARLRAGSRDVTLVRTGSDHLPDPRWARRFARQAGVVTLGWVDRSFLIDLMKSADILVQPGGPGPFNDYRLPSKLPEFLAAGRPVVLPATNLGARLRHGEEAMLLQEGSAEEMAGHIAEVGARPELAMRLGKNARAYAERHYRWEAQAGKLEAFLRSPARAAATA